MNNESWTILSDEYGHYTERFNPVRTYAFAVNFAQAHIGKLYINGPYYFYTKIGADYE